MRLKQVKQPDGKRGKVLKWHENLEVENINGKRGKVLRRHEKLEVEMVNVMRGIILKQLTVGIACISCSGFESGV